MLIDLSKTYKTRCGYDVVIYAIHDQAYAVHGAYFVDNEWRQASWSIEGKYSIEESKYDLLEVKPRIKRTYWVNLYSSNVAYFYDSQGQADANATSNCIARQQIHIDCEEGDGL